MATHYKELESEKDFCEKFNTKRIITGNNQSGWKRAGSELVTS
jgi:hypothetical protein